MNLPMEKQMFDRVKGENPAKSVFAFRSRKKLIETFNATPIEAGTSASLTARLDAALNGLDQKNVIVGALPFHYERENDSLWLARADIRTPTKEDAKLSDVNAHWSVRAQPAGEVYASAVAAALECLTDKPKTREDLTKIVLARCIDAECEIPIDLEALFNRLSLDPAVNVFQVALPQKNGLPRHMVGASPELLISKDGRKIASHPLAGSAKRQKNLALDAAFARELGRSEKDRREHGIVVEYILDILSPWCKSLKRPDGMTLTSTKSMWHLGTRIEGELRDDDVPVPILAALVHPTPAVCGWPKLRAEQTITELEPFAREFFTGAVGWCEPNGDGEWYVTLRCAEICEKTARLYAGAGIVCGSDPWMEVAETGAKMGAMMNALNIPAIISQSGENK